MDIERMTALSRRELLTGTASASLLLGAGLDARRSSAATPQPALDPVAAYRRLRYRTDAGLVFWWLRGIKYGQIGAALTALYTNHVGTVMRVAPRADGGIDVTSLEITVPMAVDGDTALREWANPYTGETLPVTVRPVGPATVSYDANGERDFPTELGGARLESGVESGSPVIVGDDVFLTEHIRARVYRPERDTPYVVNDISSYHGSLAQLTDPATTSAGATVSFGEVTGWQRWMNMGDREGSLTSRTTGAKVTRYSDMPAVWRRAVEDLMPELAAQLRNDPDSALDREVAEFDR